MTDQPQPRITFEDLLASVAPPEPTGTTAAALAWTCPHCGVTVAPFAFDLLGVTRYVRRGRCECDGAQAGEQARVQAERERACRALVVNAHLQVGKLAAFTFKAWDVRRTPDAGPALERVRDYVQGVPAAGRNWLYLHGPYGVGKTHLAVAALRQVAYERMWEPLLCVWPEHCSRVKESWDADGSGAAPSEGQLWAQMRAARILLIDDIDKADSTPWAIGKLYEVIDHRQLRERPTIITANHSIDGLKRLWEGKGRRGQEHIKDAGAAILSRIVGQLWGTVEMSGADQRWVR